MSASSVCLQLLSLGQEECGQMDVVLKDAVRLLGLLTTISHCLMAYNVVQQSLVIDLLDAKRRLAERTSEGSITCALTMAPIHMVCSCLALTRRLIVQSVT